ncbi:hypothetical protein SDC9_143398 [bioreactor metagenome]|uniref:Uncharacterized protein n=1 Tax=bioreactor metagenome TaxID=1076179 RepID=A0A645E395_9ZZZZ
MFEASVPLAVDPVHAVQALNNAYPAASGAVEYTQMTRAANDQNGRDSRVFGIKGDLYPVVAQLFRETRLE